MSIVLRTTRDQNRSTRVVILSLTAALFAFSCSSQTEFSRNGGSNAATNTPPTGSEGSDLGSPVDKGVEINGQTITHYEDKSRIAQAFLPNGSLAVGQEVTMSSSYHTDPSDLIDEFGIKKGGAIKETQVATVVSSNMHDNLKQPMTVALDLPPATGLLGLVWENRNFFVVYTVHDSNTNKWRRGIMAEKENGIEVVNNRVVFQTNMFGRYELFESVDAIKHDIKEKVVPEPDFKNPPIAISKVWPLVARAGDTITINGKYFSNKTTVAIGGVVIAANHKTFGSPQALTVTMPAGLSFGKAQVRLTDGTNSADSEIIAQTKDKDTPYADVDVTQVCNTVTFYNKLGQEKTGAKDCSIAECSSEGQSDCKITNNFRAQNNPIDYMKVFKNHRKILGVNGLKNVPEFTKKCTSSGEKGCFIKPGEDFIALKKGELTADILRKGITIPKKGEIAIEIKGAYPTGAAGSQMPGSDTATSQTLTEDILNTALTSDNVKIEFWDQNGVRQVFTTDGSLKKDLMKPLAKFYGATGENPTAKGTCTRSGNADCLAGNDYVAANSANFKDTNIKKDHEVESVTGKYPSSNAPLGTVPAGVNEVDDAEELKNALKSADDFYYFNSKGQRIKANGSNELKAENIRQGKTIFGVGGNLDDADSHKVDKKDIRAGVTIAGVAGEMRTNCRNLTEKTTIANVVTPVDGDQETLNNVQDTIKPKGNPWGDPRHSCTEDQWEQVVSTTTCNMDIRQCTYKDKITGHKWGGFNNTDQGKMTWQQAQAHCTDLNSWNIDGMSSGWQLPTLADLYQSFAHGLFYNHDRNDRFLDYRISQLRLWTMDAAEGSSTKKMTMHAHIGYAQAIDTTDPGFKQQYVICVNKN